MAQQKLYTEEQVRQAMILAATTDASYNGVLNHLIPIELPSDEEIIRVASQETNNVNEQILFNNGAIYVCKLIEQQILNK